MSLKTNDIALSHRVPAKPEMRGARKSIALFLATFFIGLGMLVWMGEKTLAKRLEAG